MSELIIRIENGVPCGHPMTHKNFLECFPEFIGTTPPSNYVTFERVERPTLEQFELFDEPELTYELIDGIVKDVWHVRDMTEEEKQLVIEDMRNITPPNGFVFNETTYMWEPPFPRPDDDQRYYWNEETLDWSLFTE